METVALVAPVTALEFIQNEFLLSGEGPVLTVFSLSPQPKSCTSLTVLHHQRIHGIRPRNSQEGEEIKKKSQQENCGPSTSSHDLAVFGGKAVRLVRLQLLNPVYLENISPVMELHDWVLDLRWMSGRPLLCVALAHNTALLLDTETGTTLYRRSCSEGCLLYSALVLAHESWSDTVLIGGTVFNQLVIWKPGDEAKDLEAKAQVERRLLGHSGVIFAITYLQKEGIIASASDDRSVRIWQVGNLGGNKGQCGDDNPVCLQVLYGHQARVFSVKLLRGKVFSAGEDGACLVWENENVVQTLKGHRSGGVRALAISLKSCEKLIWVATGGADGGVRLWKLGVKPVEAEGNKEKLLDLKFPKDKMDGTEKKKQKVNPEDDVSGSKGVKSQNTSTFSKLEVAEIVPQVDNPKSEIGNTVNKREGTVGNLETNETHVINQEDWSPKTQHQSNLEMLKTKVCQNADAKSKSLEKMEADQEVEKTLPDLDIVAIGVPKVICTLDSKNLTWNDCSFIVCTDKGGVCQYSNGKWQQIWQGPPEFQSYCVMEVASVKTKDSLVNLCAVGNISGSVQVFPVGNPKSGICLEAGNGKIHSIIWCKEKENKGAWLLASGSDGLVYRWWVRGKESAYLEFEITEMPSFELPNCAKRWLTTAIRAELGKDVVWVCGDRRGSLLLYQECEGYKIPNVGEESGMVMEKLSQATRNLEPKEDTVTDKLPDQTEESRKFHQDCEANVANKVTSESKRMLKLTPVSILFGVHGKQGVTSVLEHSGLFYSTGRDGCVRIFQVSSKVSERLENYGDLEKLAQEFVLEIFRVQRACKGMEWLEKVLILETTHGHDVEQFEGLKRNVDDDKEPTESNLPNVKVIDSLSKQNVQEVRFAIVGFHGNHFVVWDPVRQERLLSVLCGGGHRSWSLWTNKKGHWNGNGALVFIKQGTVLASERSLTETNGKLSWTLREGIHGRGIGCVCRLGHIMSESNAFWEVIVTGGEDTSVTVLALNPKNGDIKVLAVLTDHISSVRALTAVVNQDGSTKALSALVMSAGGRAQMQCFRLLIGCNDMGGTPSCQVIQVAGHRLDEQWERKRNRHKMVKTDPETRYMSMAVLEQTPDSLTLAVACSDGAIRLFSVSEVNRHIELLWESFHHQRCVLSVATCCLEDRQGFRHTLLFSAATDGSIAVWNFHSFSLSNQLPHQPVFTFPAHQSGVNSLEVYPTQLNDFYHIIVASGGDDGQLTVSDVKIQFLPSPAASHLKNQLSVNFENKCSAPSAHAAPLTSLKFLNEHVIVSTSCDQRVCLWRVGGAGISHQRAVCSHVADAAALAVWEDKCDQKSGSRAEVTVGEGAKSGNDETEKVHIERSEVGQTSNGFALVCGQGLQLIHVCN